MLALTLMLGCFSVSISSSALTYSNFDYEVNNNKATITGYKGSGSVIIPESLAGIPVVEIASNAFKNCFNITAISIPGTVKTVGKSAFEGDYNIQTVTIAEGVTSIGDRAFASSTKITSVTLPASLTTLGKDAFYGCTALASIDVAEGSTSFSSDNGVLYNGSGSKLIKYPEGNSSASYTLKDTTTEIEENAFRNNKSLDTVVFNNGLKTIGAYSFCNATGLMNVGPFDTVETIKEFAFSGCTKLNVSDLGDSLKTAEQYIFENCPKISTIELPNTVEALDENAFSKIPALASITVAEGGENYSSVDGVLYNADQTTLIKYPQAKDDKSFEFPGTVQNIAEGAFKNVTALEDITFNENLKTIPKNTFTGSTGLKSVVFKEGLESIEASAFEGCTALENIAIPNSVASIGTAAFKNCSSLSDVTLGSGITTVSDYLFEGCESLESVSISDNVETINISAFNGCTGLKEINVSEDNQFYSSVDGILFNKAGDTLIKYPSGREATSYIVPDAVTTIEKFAFQDNCNLETIDLNNVETLKDYVFTGSKKLKEIEIPQSVTKMGNGCFKDCAELKTAVLNNVIKTVSPYTFNNCPKLSSVTLPSGIETLGSASFEQCSGLKSIELPDTLTAINDNVFFGSGLTRIDIPEGVTRIGNTAFNNSLNLREATIPASVRVLSENLFYGCTALENIFVDDANAVCEDIDGVLYNKSCTILLQYPLGNKRGKYQIPEGTTTVFNNAFKFSQNLMYVEAPEALTKIMTNGFYGSPKLIKFKIPESTTIEYGAFDNCGNGLTLYGVEGSPAETFANTYNINFVAGDVEFDECDLYVSDVRPTASSIADGDEAGFYIVLRNIGENACLQDISIDFYIDNVYKETVVYKDGIDKGTIKIIPVSNKWNAYFGTHSIRAIIKSDDIAQSDTTNDSLKTRIIVAD